ncbi:RNA-binding protein Musashi homolog 2 [Tachysurus ichikawai]
MSMTCSPARKACFPFCINWDVSIIVSDVNRWTPVSDHQHAVVDWHFCGLLGSVAAWQLSGKTECHSLPFFSFSTTQTSRASLTAPTQTDVFCLTATPPNILNIGVKESVLYHLVSKPVLIFSHETVECKKAQPKEVMFPPGTRGRARGLPYTMDAFMLGMGMLSE